VKPIDPKDVDRRPAKRLRSGETFRFRCHPKIGCFNRCCRNLNLFLYPYDVVRLKQGLGISSDQFLDRYVDIVLREGNFFPDVLLRMAENEEMTCPFLTDSGCAVYPDRPDTCRRFPVEQGLLYGDDPSSPELVQFFRPPVFCLGQHETVEWTAETWSADQEAERYEKMTIRWARLKALFAVDPWGPEGPEGPRAKMAFMATYNIDRFREFVFGSSFLRRYKIKKETLMRCRASDESLLVLGFDWVGFFLFGIPSKKIKPK
jgi:Fe-S-cluster containining protein